MNTPDVIEQSQDANGGCVQRVVRTRWNDYAVWRQACPHNVCPGDWVLTGHKLKARSDKDAQSRLKRVFEGCGFSSMRLVAMPVGKSPNEKLTA